MADQHVLSGQHISRRSMIKGLAALTLMAGEIGCASPPATSPVTPTPTPRPGSVLYTYKGHSDQVLTAIWSPDGRRIASGSRDMTVQVWDAFTGKHALIYREHRDGVPSIAWSPDGRRIASASWDKTVQVWDAVSGNHLYTYAGHTAAVNSVSWSPDGRYIASGAADKHVSVWNASTGDLLYPTQVIAQE